MPTTPAVQKGRVVPDFPVEVVFKRSN